MPGSAGGALVHVNPILNVSDLQDSIRFYTEVLDFEVLGTFGSRLTSGSFGGTGTRSISA